MKESIKIAKELVKIARELCSSIKPPKSKVNVTLELTRKQGLAQEYKEVQEANIVFGTNATLVIETFSGSILEFSSLKDVGKVLRKNTEFIPNFKFGDANWWIRAYGKDFREIIKDKFETYLNDFEYYYDIETSPDSYFWLNKSIENINRDWNLRFKQFKISD